jgi:hypothetical protein
VISEVAVMIFELFGMLFGNRGNDSELCGFLSDIGDSKIAI